MEMDEDYLLTEELLVVQILDGISGQKMKKDDDFFRDSYRSFLQSRKKQSTYGELQVVEEELEKCSFDKEENKRKRQTLYDETNEEMLLDLEFYNDIYQLPIFMVTNREWNLFFKEMCSYYFGKGLREVYLPDMVTLNKMAIAKSLIDNQEEITLSTYICALKYMESEVISISEILEVIERLEVTFEMKNLKELIRNADGSYGNYNKKFTIPIEGVENMDAYFFQDGVEEIIVDDGSKMSDKEVEDNIVSFQKYLIKGKK